MSDFGVCLLAAIPLRAEPADSSEMVSQILFGETFEILESNAKWHKTKCTFDDYIGWIDKKQAILISEQQFNHWNSSNLKPVNIDFCYLENLQTKSLMRIPAGSTIPANTENLTLGLFQYKIIDKFFDYKNENQKTAIINFAKQFLNAPYLWGGRTAMGFDCSGFTQIIFKVFGVNLLRNASQQADFGELVNFLNEAQAGDIAFFDNEEMNINHVGILLSNNQIIHCSGQVRIDTIDHNGIFNNETQSYSHKLRFIKRILK